MSVIGGAYMKPDGRMHIVIYGPGKDIPTGPHVGMVYYCNERRVGEVEVKFFDTYTVGRPPVSEPAPPPPPAPAAQPAPVRVETSSSSEEAVSTDDSDEDSPRKRRKYDISFSLDEIKDFLRANIAKEDSADFCRFYAKIDAGFADRIDVRRIAAVRKPFYDPSVIPVVQRLEQKYKNIVLPDASCWNVTATFIGYRASILRVWKYLLHYRAELTEFFRTEWAAPSMAERIARFEATTRRFMAPVGNLQPTPLMETPPRVRFVLPESSQEGTAQPAAETLVS